MVWPPTLREYLQRTAAEDIYNALCKPVTRWVYSVHSESRKEQVFQLQMILLCMFAQNYPPSINHRKLKIMSGYDLKTIKVEETPSVGNFALRDTSLPGSNTRKCSETKLLKAIIENLVDASRSDLRRSDYAWSSILRTSPFLCQLQTAKATARKDPLLSLAHSFIK
jgi:hypothetical protein